jgi:hypothetical protein
MEGGTILNGYEVLLFSESAAPVFRAWRSSEKEALDYAGKELRASRGSCYNAAIWNSCPSFFLVLYVNDRGEIFQMQDPIILSRADARRLRRRPIGEGGTNGNV